MERVSRTNERTTSHCVHISTKPKDTEWQNAFLKCSLLGKIQRLWILLSPHYDTSSGIMQLLQSFHPNTISKTKILNSMNPERLTFNNDTPIHVILFRVLTGPAEGGGDMCPNSTITNPRLDVVIPAAMTFLGESGFNQIGWNMSENEIKQYQHQWKFILIRFWRGLDLDTLSCIAN